MPYKNTIAGIIYLVLRYARLASALQKVGYEFHFALKQAHDNQKVRVAMVASWTESDGDHKWRLKDRPYSPLKNIRVGPVLQSGKNIYPKR